MSQVILSELQLHLSDSKNNMFLSSLIELQLSCKRLLYKVGVAGKLRVTGVTRKLRVTDVTGKLRVTDVTGKHV